ncbi:MAG TPA: pirin family protein [Phycisphaerales bacterium]|nr:pirin family protein [Phycisphaerales bacterium]
MLTIRRSSERGHFDHGWLDTFHTFSFGDYHDPQWMSFGPLRVINEDVVAPGAGFPKHPHRDMEIVTYILSGAIDHEDSSGGKGTIRPGEVQAMSAGRGILHSEYNPSKTEPVHLLQIWIKPRENGLAPRYDQRAIRVGEGSLKLIASADGRDGAIPIHQDAEILAGKLKPGARAEHELKPQRRAWVQMARGSAKVNGSELNPGDGVGITGEPRVTIEPISDAEVLLFDLP